MPPQAHSGDGLHARVWAHVRVRAWGGGAVTAQAGEKKYDLCCVWTLRLQPGKVLACSSSILCFYLEASIPEPMAENVP